MLAVLVDRRARRVLLLLGDLRGDHRHLDAPRLVGEVGVVLEDVLLHNVEVARGEGYCGGWSKFNFMVRLVDELLFGVGCDPSGGRVGLRLLGAADNVRYQL